MSGFFNLPVGGGGGGGSNTTIAFNQAVTSDANGIYLGLGTIPAATLQNGIGGLLVTGIVQFDDAGTLNSYGVGVQITPTSAPNNLVDRGLYVTPVVSAGAPFSFTLQFVAFFTFNGALTVASFLGVEGSGLLSPVGGSANTIPEPWDWSVENRVRCAIYRNVAGTMTVPVITNVIPTNVLIQTIR